MLRPDLHHAPIAVRAASLPQRLFGSGGTMSSQTPASSPSGGAGGRRQAFSGSAVAICCSAAAFAAGVSSCGQVAPRPELPSSASAPSGGVSEAGIGGPDGGFEASSDSLGDASGPDVLAAENDAGADGMASAVASEADGGGEEPCPSGMKLVDTDYCPNVDRKCLDEEYSPQNHIVICHRFARDYRCLAPLEHKRFCIDEYEYPNRAGAHPPWMVSWYDAQATCQLQQKRVCFESEWITACEGPEKTPFPYGYARDNAKCNIDNMWIEPSLAGMYSKNPDISGPELSRLDQSVPSGAREECVSGFGVHDLTGNFDEWVTADVEHKDKSQWAGLKGGAWGHVRNACRPVTTSHPPDFTYYFIAFRCCKDASDAPPYIPPGNPRIPAVTPADRAPLPVPVNPPGPSEKKVGRERWGGKP